MKLSTNIPDALYQQIEILANKQSIPVEQLVTMALAAQISSWMTKDYLEEKARRGSWDKLEQTLAKVSDREPEDYDKL
jgi:fructosamine-3-kinase